MNAVLRDALYFQLREYAETNSVPPTFKWIIAGN
jgi:hypothetical protein